MRSATVNVEDGARCEELGRSRWRRQGPGNPAGRPVHADDDEKARKIGRRLMEYSMEHSVSGAVVASVVQSTTNA